MSFARGCMSTLWNRAAKSNQGGPLAVARVVCGDRCPAVVRQQGTLTSAFDLENNLRARTTESIPYREIEP